MNEYRITRPDSYPEGSPGHTDPSQRQGYYIVAVDTASALVTYRGHWEDPNSRLDIELWKEGVNIG